MPLPTSLVGEKRVENLLQIFLRNTGAIILEEDAPGLSAQFRSDADTAFWLMCLDRLSGVVDDIEENLLELVRIEPWSAASRAEDLT